MSREDAINTLARFKTYISGGGVVDKTANEAINMAIEALKEPERNIGKWIKKEPYYRVPTQCSECGHEFVEYVEGYEWEETGELPAYCQNCGAKMEEE